MGSKGVMVSGDEFSRNVPRKKPSFSERTKAFLTDQKATQAKGREIRRQQGGGQAAPPLSLSSDIDVSLLVDIANLLSLDGGFQGLEKKIKVPGPRDPEGPSYEEDYRRAMEDRNIEVPSGFGEPKKKDDTSTVGELGSGQSETSLAIKDPDSTAVPTRWAGMADDEPPGASSTEPESTTEADDTSSTSSSEPSPRKRWSEMSESERQAGDQYDADTSDTPEKTGRMRAAGKKLGTGARDFGTGFGEGFSGGREESSGGVNINIGGGTTAGGAGATTAIADTSAADDASLAESVKGTGPSYTGEPTKKTEPKKPLSTPPIVSPSTTYTQTKITPPVKPTPTTKTPASPTTAIKPTKPQTALGSGQPSTASPTAATTPTKTPMALGPGQPSIPPTSSSTDKPTGTSTIDKPIGKSWTYSG